MAYLFAKIKQSYEDLSSGRVLYNAPGLSAFPVRLSSEIIQTCFSILEKKGVKGPYTVYDPCCGGAYLLTTLSFLHRSKIKKIYASDYDPIPLLTAQRNLSLLSSEGLTKRLSELQTLAKDYQKASHYEAIKSAKKLLEISQLQEPSFSVETVCFQNNILELQKNLFKVNIFIADLPYDRLTSWSTEKDTLFNLFFQNLVQYCDPHSSVIALITDKKIKVPSSFNLNFITRRTFKLGKRNIYIFS